MKKFIKLSLLLLTLLLPATTMADDFEVDGLYYSINGNEATVTGYNWNELPSHLTIPSTVTHDGTTYSVTAIGDDAFVYCEGLTSVTIPNSVTTIGNYAFFGCTGLTSIDIPNSVTSIGDHAFEYCSGLTSIDIPNSVTSIGNGAFSDCSGLTSIDIPNSVTSIGDDVFYYCEGLTSVTIPNSVTSIGYSAFSGCSGLTSVTIPNSVTTIGNYAFAYCSGLTSVTIPNSVTSIGNGAFNECGNLISITVSSGNPKYDSRDNCNAIIETASNTLIQGCQNTTIPNSVTTIGYSAFADCSGLTSVTIPNSVTTIGYSAFFGCSELTSVTIPNSVTSIGDHVFSGCEGLTSITVSSGNPKYDSRDNCNAIIETATNSLIQGCQNTTIPNSVTSIGTDAFRGHSGLTSVTIPNSVTSISDGAFYDCSGLTSVTIPNSVTTIGNHAFNYTPWFDNQPDGLVYAGLVAYKYKGTMPEGTSITIREGTQGIASSAFSGCSGLTSVTIPNSVTSIGNQAFYYCYRLNEVYCRIPDPSAISMGSDVFYRYTYNYDVRTLYVPYGSKAAYQSDTRWSQYFGNIVEMTNTVTSIELDKTTAVLAEGETMQLSATVLPKDAADITVNWATSNPEVATVDGNGLVTALSVGTATITAMTADGSNLSASCAVTVRSLSASESLSIDNLTAFHGDTIVIPVKMVNEAKIISFQTDIYMPDGLELLQEDGEYMIDPSERMTRTHSIMSNAVSNGAIRVVCYSSNYKPFTGESGDDLFYLTVKVDDDAEGDYIIRLKNTLFTTSDFDEIAAPDAAGIVNVKAYIPGDANNSGTVTVTDVVVASQYILELNPEPFNFAAADVNTDGSITVTDVSRIAWMVLNPTLNAPLRAPALWNNGDRLSGSDITLAAGETRTVSITLDNVMDYSAFQLDLRLPEGLTASNFAVTDRAGYHAFDVNTLCIGDIRVLCYSPTLTAISGHEGALLTFDVTAIGAVNGNITVDGIELVTTGCQTVRLDAFAIGVNTATSVNEVASGKTVTSVGYFNLAGQQITEPSTGVTLIVTTYSDGTRTTTKIIQ